MKKIITWLCLGLIVAAATWALVPTNFFRAHDYVHAARIAEMTRALSDGHFPVRWTQNFGYGYGMPLFEFYAPLPYYVGSLFYWLGLEVVAAVKILFLMTAVVTAGGAYQLGKKLFGRLGGILTAATLTLAPYRAVNLFIRGALSEAWGMMAMPWILLQTIRLIKQEKNAWQKLVFWYVVLMLSHNIMTMLFVPFSLLFAVLYLGYRKWLEQDQGNNQLRSLWQLVGSLTLAVGLSSFYLLPAYFEKDLTKVGSIFSGYFHYSQHFLYLRQFMQVNWGFTGSVWGPGDGISFFLGWGQWVGLGILFLLGLKRLRQEWREKGLAAVWRDKKFGLIFMLVVLLVFSLFMTLMHSHLLWQAIPWLAYVQFPWRFLGIGILFVGLLVGATSLLVKKKLWRILLGFLILVSTFYNTKFFKPEKFLDNADRFYYTEADRIQRQMSSILPDYIPQAMANDLTPPEKTAWCESGCEDQVEVKIDRVHEKLIKTNFETEQTLQLAVASYPGWAATIDGQKLETVKGEAGNLAAKVPAGHQLLAIEFKSTAVRWYSDLLSLISLLVLGYLLLEPKLKS